MKAEALSRYPNDRWLDEDGRFNLALFDIAYAILDGNDFGSSGMNAVEPYVVLPPLELVKLMRQRADRIESLTEPA